MGGSAGELEIREGRDVPIDALMELYRHTDWARARNREGVVRCLADTSVLLTGWHQGRLAAMLRILSDWVYRGVIDDVIVHPDYQGKGWGRVIMEAALAHPSLREVEEVALFTVIPVFYEKFGFARDPMAMKLKRPRSGPGFTA